MTIRESLRRAFMGGIGSPSTEDVQRTILTYLEGRGSGDTGQMEEELFTNIPASSRRHQILQAAQILVNRRLVRATVEGRGVDPVNAVGPVRLELEKR